MTVELDALRWGDVQQVSFTPGTVAAETSTVVSRQLVAANWRVPMSWNVLIFAIPLFNAAENGSVTISWQFSLGGGQAASTTIPLFTMGPLAKAQNGICSQQQQLVPSSNLQIAASLAFSLTTQNTANIYVGAFVAPNNTEPFAERDFQRWMMGEGSAEERRGAMRWMPMGFYGDMDPLKFRGR